MTKTASYGIGQYTYDPIFEYISLLQDTTENVKDNVVYTPDTTTSYIDVAFKLPDGIEYGNTYYMELTLPQDHYYNTTVNLKLCAEDPLGGKETFNVDFNKFQQIKQLTIPAKDTDPTNSLYSKVVLFEYQPDNGGTKVVAADVPVNAANLPADSQGSSKFTASQLYELNGVYKYAIADSPSWDSSTLIGVTKYSQYNLAQTWKITSEDTTAENSTITYSFVFSPKYNLTEGYKYLWIEVVHDSEDIRLSDQVQTYNGRTLPKDSMSMALYKINNLLPETILGIASIKSGINTLTGLTITGSPKLIATINGEEIRVSSTGQYELKDFEITSLGLVVKDVEDANFLVDYTYAIKN